MGSTAVELRQARAERLAGYFEVQLVFAERMAAAAGLPLGEATLRYTNLHRRFGWGRIGPEGGGPEWAGFAARLTALGSLAERLALTVETFALGGREAHDEPHAFGCFAFEPPDAEGGVRIHFHNRETEDEVGPLAREKRDRRVAELTAMFGFLRAEVPKARRVVGGSWLYHLEAYRRLFPESYTAACRLPDRVRLDGTSSWGQLLDHQERVKPAVRAALVANLQGLDPAAPWLVFPLRALVTSAPVEDFYRRYGV